MKLLLISIHAGRTRTKSGLADELAAEFTGRIDRYVPCTNQAFDSEAGFLKWADKQAGRTAPVLVLLDSRGKQFISKDFAAHLGRVRDSGAQTVVFAIGPADGWSAVARGRADLLLSFGEMTLPHELARVVLAEQVYRALTILAGHPYHSGH